MRLVPDESEREARPFFKALEESGYVLAADVYTDPATREFFVGRSGRSRVESLMAAAFALNGKLYGALTCTQVGGRLNWTPKQLALLRQIGSRTTLALANVSPSQLNSLWASLD